MAKAISRPRVQMNYADCDPKAAKCATTFNGMKYSSSPFRPGLVFNLTKAALGYVLNEGQVEPDENTNYSPVIMTDVKVADNDAAIWIKNRYYFGFTEVDNDGSVKGEVELTGTFDKAFTAFIEEHADDSIESVVCEFLKKLLDEGKTKIKVGSFVRVNIEKMNYVTKKFYVKRNTYIPMFDFAD